MIQVHTGGLQTVILLLIQCVKLILDTFLILSAQSMIEFFKTIINCFNGDDTGSCSRAANSYPYCTHFQYYQRHL